MSDLRERGVLPYEVVSAATAVTQDTLVWHGSRERVYGSDFHLVEVEVQRDDNTLRYPLDEQGIDLKVLVYSASRVSRNRSIVARVRSHSPFTGRPASPEEAYVSLYMDGFVEGTSISANGSVVKTNSEGDVTLSTPYGSLSWNKDCTSLPLVIFQTPFGTPRLAVIKSIRLPKSWLQNVPTPNENEQRAVVAKPVTETRPTTTVRAAVPYRERHPENSQPGKGSSRERHHAKNKQRQERQKARQQKGRR